MCSSGGGITPMSSVAGQAVAGAKSAAADTFQRNQDGVRSSWSSGSTTGGAPGGDTLLTGADAGMQPIARRTTLLGQ